MSNYHPDNLGLDDYDGRKSPKGWVIGFFILLLLIVIMGISNVSKSTQIDKLNASISQYKSSNAQGQKQCISDAQDLYNAGGGITPNAGTNLTASVSACQAQFPTN
jgi:hypothetical protein